MLTSELSLLTISDVKHLNDATAWLWSSALSASAYANLDTCDHSRNGNRINLSILNLPTQDYRLFESLTTRFPLAELFHTTSALENASLIPINTALSSRLIPSSLEFLHLVIFQTALK